MGYSPLKLNIITDTHYFSKENGTSGKAYDFANLKSQKLLADSAEVLQTAFDQIAADNETDILLISGDVTNNGEYNSHAEFISMLREFKAKGKRVYVLTATHDFRGEGYTDGYNGDETYKVTAAKREELFEMYREFGPDEALSVHQPSMSYIVQLCDGYRLFALNDDTNLSGKSGFSDECFEWITEQVRKAKEDNQFIIAMTHHPLIAPSPIYEIIGRGDMLGDYKMRIEQLANLGVQFIFTGHTHIHNISAYQSEEGNVLYDICTASPIGYPGAIRTAWFDPENKTVKLDTVYVETPESFKKEGKDLRTVLENQLTAVIFGMIKTAGEDIDKLANMVNAISVKPKLVYKFGWIIKPIFKLINSLKIGTVAKWTKRETGLKKTDYASIKDIKVVDFIAELFMNLFGGESKYPPETPQYKITIGFLNIIDSILSLFKIDLLKITKVSSTTAELVEPLLYNCKIDSYKAELEIFPVVSAGDSPNKKLEFIPRKSDVKKSRKGLPIIIVLALIIIAFLPVWLILLLSGFIINRIKYGNKLK